MKVEEEGDCRRLWMDQCMRTREEEWRLHDGKVVVAVSMVLVGGVDCL